MLVETTVVSGLAVIVDWERPVAERDLDPMLALIPHRAAGGAERVVFEHAGLAATVASSDGTATPCSATAGHVAIVGDLRLWNRDRLRSRAGGHSATAGMGDHQLILEAYRRAGLAALDFIDGDFAFVIWDDRERRLIAVRDRFGVKPLFFERTRTGIRLASESKQLVATSARQVEPDEYAVAEYLLERNRETRSTYFSGIERVLPSTALVMGETRSAEVAYWSPNGGTSPAPPGGNPAIDFRERLADSVRRRVESSQFVVSHLSGGLDSASIAASAHLLVERDLIDPDRFHTTSAVFPGHAIDESLWINEIVENQPFRHHEAIPRIDDASLFERDMWVTDQPRVDRIRGMWSDTARFAAEVGASLVFTGIGGDDVLDYYALFGDRMKSGPIARRWRDLRAHAEWRSVRIDQALVATVREGLPVQVKRPLRKLLRRSAGHRGLLSEDAWRAYLARIPAETPLEFGYPSDTQNLVVAASRHPLLGWSNEMQEAEYASRGLDLTHPYLDRSVIEYLASISIDDRPFDGRTKAIVREGFSSQLPQSVLNRRTKTFADEYLATIFCVHAPHFRSRFPEVTEAGAPYLDRGRYRALLATVDAAAQTDDERETLWAAWTLMTWLDGLSRYRNTRIRTIH